MMPVSSARQNQPAVMCPIGFLEVIHLVGNAVRPHQHVREQVHGEHRATAAAHRGGDIAVGREATALLIAGLPDLVGGSALRLTLNQCP